MSSKVLASSGKPKPPNAGKGRKKGVPNKVTGEIKAMVVEALTNAGGAKYLERQARDNPSAFMALVGRVLPLQVGGDPNGVPIAVREIRNYLVTDGAADEA